MWEYQPNTGNIECSFDWNKYFRNRLQTNEWFDWSIRVNYIRKIRQI